MPQLELDGIAGQAFSPLGYFLCTVLRAGKVVYARSAVDGQIALPRDVYVRERSTAVPILGRRIDVKNLRQDPAFESAIK